MIHSRTPRTPRTLVLLGALAVCNVSLARAQLPRLSLEPCGVDGGRGTDARCGSIRVPENRAATGGRQIELRVMILPARAQSAAPDPIFYLVGGPGQAASSAATALMRRTLRDDRDVVLIDQRGTGGPDALRCPELGHDGDVGSYFVSAFEPANVRACRAALEQRADLTKYATLDAIADFEDVRRALGYERINLWGGSAGTRTALQYARMHPNVIRTMTLAAVAPIALANPLPHARAAQDALDKLVAQCERTPDCAAAFPSIPSKLATVLARLDSAPATVRISHPTEAREVDVVFTRAQFADGLRTTMYGSAQARLIPALIESAFRGDFRPSAEMALTRARALRGGIAMGVLLTVTCTEDVPRIRDAQIAPAVRGTFIGSARVDTQRAACAEWARGPMRREYETPVKSAVPSLLFSGEYDPVIPRQWGDSAAKHLKNARHIVVPMGHALFHACTDDITKRFLAAGSVRGLDDTCVAGIQLPRFASLQELRPARAQRSDTLKSRYVEDRFFMRPVTTAGDTLHLFTDTGGGDGYLTLAAIQRIGGLLRVLNTRGADTAWGTPWPEFRADASIPSPNLGDRALMYVPTGRRAIPGPIARLLGEDGFLGKTWFAGRVWTFDYPGRRMILHSDAVAPSPRARVLSVGFKTDSAGARVDHYPRVQITVAGEPLDMLFDTGASTALTDSAAATVGDGRPAFRSTSFIRRSVYDQWRAKHPDWRVIQGAEAASGMEMIEARDVAIGGFAVGPVWFTVRNDINYVNFSRSFDQPIVGAIGGNAFRTLKLTLDYPRATLTVEQP